MSGNTYVGQGGTWRQWKSGTSVGVGGVWQPAKFIYVGVGGAWQQIFAAAALSAGPGGSYSDNDPGGTGGASVALEINTLGHADVTTGSGSIQTQWDWVTPTSLAPGDYLAEVVVSNGAFTSGSSAAVGSNVTLSTDRAWSIVVVGSGSTLVDFTLYIKDGSGNVLSSQTYSFTASVA